MILSIGGFRESDPTSPVVQPESAEFAVLIGITLVPAAIILIGVLMTFKYDLTSAKLSQVSQDVT